MNNKNITILTILVLTIAIAILVLTIFKGNEMKEWFKKNVLCCFGKKEEEEEKKKVESIDAEIQTDQSVMNSYGTHINLSEEFRKIDEAAKKEKKNIKKKKKKERSKVN